MWWSEFNYFISIVKKFFFQLKYAVRTYMHVAPNLIFSSEFQLLERSKNLKRGDKRKRAVYVTGKQRENWYRVLGSGPSILSYSKNKFGIKVKVSKLTTEYDRCRYVPDKCCQKIYEWSFERLSCEVRSNFRLFQKKCGRMKIFGHMNARERTYGIYSNNFKN